jgi:hypothetical protein
MAVGELEETGQHQDKDERDHQEAEDIVLEYEMVQSWFGRFLS